MYDVLARPPPLGVPGRPARPRHPRLLILTNDHEVGERLTSPVHGGPKTYHARVAGRARRTRRWGCCGEGLLLDDGTVTRPAQCARHAGVSPDARPDLAGNRAHRGPQPPGPAHGRGRSVTRFSSWCASGSGVSGSARSPPGEWRELGRGGGAYAVRPATGGPRCLGSRSSHSPPLRPPLPTRRSAPRPSGWRRPWSPCAATCTPTPSSATARSAPGTWCPSGCATSASRCAPGREDRRRGRPAGRPPGRCRGAARRHGRAADRGDERPAVHEPDAGRDARLRPRRPHRDPARRRRGARGPEGAAARHRRVPVPARRGGRPRGRRGRCGADGARGRARRPEGRGRLRPARRRLGRLRPGRLDRRADLRLGRRLHDRGRGQDRPRRAAPHGARPDPGRLGDRDGAADDRLAPDRRPPAPRAHDRPHPGRHALQHHRRPGGDGRHRCAPTTRPCARR